MGHVSKALPNQFTRVGVTYECVVQDSEDELRPPPDFRKTKLCRMFQKGLCSHTDCPRAHGDQERRIINQFYKTKACKYWRDHGTCTRGDDCYFAHTLEVEKRYPDVHQIVSNLYATVKQLGASNETNGDSCRLLSTTSGDSANDTSTWSDTPPIESVLVKPHLSEEVEQQSNEKKLDPYWDAQSFELRDRNNNNNINNNNDNQHLSSTKSSWSSDEEELSNLLGYLMKSLTADVSTAKQTSFKSDYGQIIQHSERNRLSNEWGIPTVANSANQAILKMMHSILEC